jgi:hypothetical protein
VGARALEEVRVSSPLDPSPRGNEPTRPVTFTKPADPPGVPEQTAPPAAPPYAAPNPPYGPPGGQAQQGLGVGRIIGLVLASLLALFSLGVTASGGVLAWAHESRSADGFLSTGTEPLSTPTAALSSAKVDINVGGVGWFADHLGTIRITATSTNGKPVFIGIAPQSDVLSWLGSTSIDQIKDLQFEPFSVTLNRMPGTIASVRPPGAEAFWTARSTTTTGSPLTQTLTWKVTRGNWAVVVANADGSPNVAVAAQLGAKFSWLGPLSIGLIVAGLVLLIIAVVAIILLLRSRRRRPLPVQQYPQYPPYQPPPASSA